MRSLLKHMVLPGFLFISWLLLNKSFSVGNIVLGLIIALLLTWLASWLRPLRAYPKHPWTAIKLIVHVAIDIGKSTYDVGKLVWTWPHAGATPGFLEIPLRIRDPHALAALSCIITYTPGTVWADHSSVDNILILHVLDLKDEEAWRRTIQNRYETPLLEIFE